MRTLKRKINHRLEIGTEVTLSKSLSNRKTGSAFSITRKLVMMIVAATLFISTGIAAVSGFTPQAHAIKVDPISDMLCPTVNNGTSYLGGISQEIINGFNGKTGDAPWEGLFGVWSIPKEDRENIAKGAPVTNDWTTLERYGFYATEYSNWVGMQTHYPLERLFDEVFSDGKLPYMGTGGNPGGFGAFMYILDGQNSPMFSHGIMDCIPVASHINVVTANTFQSINQSLSALALNFYSISGNLSLSDENSILFPLGEVFTMLIAGDPSKDVKGLKDLLFLDFILPLIMIAGIAIALQYRKDTSGKKLFFSIVWIVAVVAGGMLLLSKPLIISDTVDTVVNATTGVLSEAVLQTSGGSPECKLPSGAPQKVEREISCYIWMQNVYKFWVEGQFGMPYEQAISMNTDPAAVEGISEFGDPKDAKTFQGLNPSNWAGINKSSFSSALTDEEGNTAGAENFLALTALGYNAREYYPDHTTLFDNGKPVGAEPRADNTRGALTGFTPHLGARKDVTGLQNWPYYQMDTAATWPVSNGYNYSEVAYNQLVIEGNTKWKNPTEAVVQSFGSLSFSGLPLIVMMLFSITLVTLQLTMTFIIVVAPFVLTVAVLARFGQNVTASWVNLITSVAIRRIIITFFFFLYLKLYFLILDSEMETVFKMILVTIVSIIMYTVKDQIANAIALALQIKTGDNMSETERGGYLKAIAAAGATKQAASAIAATRRRNKEYQGDDRDVARIRRDREEDQARRDAERKRRREEREKKEHEEAARVEREKLERERLRREEETREEREREERERKTAEEVLREERKADDFRREEEAKREKRKHEEEAEDRRRYSNKTAAEAEETNLRNKEASEEPQNSAAETKRRNEEAEANQNGNQPAPTAPDEPTESAAAGAAAGAAGAAGAAQTPPNGSTTGTPDRKNKTADRDDIEEEDYELDEETNEKSEKAKTAAENPRRLSDKDKAFAYTVRDRLAKTDGKDKDSTMQKMVTNYIRFRKPETGNKDERSYSQKQVDNGLRHDTLIKYIEDLTK